MIPDKFDQTGETSVQIVKNKTFKMPFCGPKLSNCCFVISIWGIVMLGIMGVLFRVESVALLEDIPKMSTDTEGYQAASTNCFIAAAIYVVFFIFTGYQKYAINRGYSRL